MDGRVLDFPFVWGQNVFDFLHFLYEARVPRTLVDSPVPEGTLGSQIQAMVYSFNAGSGVLNSGPFACTARALPTEPSPHPCQVPHIRKNTCILSFWT